MGSTKKNEATNVMFAAPVNQEFATSVVNTAHEFGIDVKLSNVGCTPGFLGVYAEFASNSLKKVFLDEIAGTYNPEFVWVA